MTHLEEQGQGCPPTYRDPEGFLNVEDKVLQEGHLVKRVDQLEPCRRHLRQRQQEQGRGVYLEVAPGIVPHNGGAGTWGGGKPR